jgi:hypothetical protein
MYRELAGAAVRRQTSLKAEKLYAYEGVRISERHTCEALFEAGVRYR